MGLGRRACLADSPRLPVSPSPQSFLLVPPPVACGNLAADRPVLVYRFLASASMVGGTLQLDADEPGSTGVSVLTLLASPNANGSPLALCA